MHKHEVLKKQDYVNNMYLQHCSVYLNKDQLGMMLCYVCLTLQNSFHNLDKMDG